MKSYLLNACKIGLLLILFAISSSLSAQTVVNVLINQPQKLDISATELTTQNADTLVLGESVSIAGGTAPYQYNWLNGSQHIGATLIVKLPHTSANGDYTLNVIDANNCSCSKNSTQLGINNPNESKSVISIFPNPTSGRISVNYQNPELLYITVFDYKGIVVYNSQITGNSNLDLNLPSGLYFLKIENKDKKLVESKKMIVL